MDKTEYKTLKVKLEKLISSLRFYFKNHGEMEAFIGSLILDLEGILNIVNDNWSTLPINFIYKGVNDFLARRSILTDISLVLHKFRLYEGYMGEREKENEFVSQKEFDKEMEMLDYLIKYSNYFNAYALFVKESLEKESLEKEPLEKEPLEKEGGVFALEEKYYSRLADLENRLTELTTRYEAEVIKFTRIKERSNHFAKYLEENKKELDKNSKYLDTLIPGSVGASLFGTFKYRKDELIKSVRFWVITTLFAAGGTFYYITLLFGNTNYNSMVWQEYVANTIKLSPFFIFLFFCIRQYQRERNFQEEYAFKSAVALTIDAYSKQIGDQDKRDNMIIESVVKVYDSPIEKHLTKENIKNRSMLKGIEVVKEAVVETAKDVAEVAKKIK